ncbi:Gldg family protein [Caldimonas taiwanensis]|uniref:Gldg family protein n=1 Tax=Caldimonas taiwanensis TaxID=307483 RepID=UPI000781028F|nr:Gldg family protein [Caldimonas taiwanensis]
MRDCLREIGHIARKEFRGHFASPAAYLFIAAFLAATLFVVFWVEAYFARNIADVRPLFRWMPLLLIFLVAALTMRSWSEERRFGTMETLLTAPVRPASLVLGKFLATWALVALALALTWPVVFTAAWLGPLDPGPVVGGYVATLLLAAAYVAIGQTLSARTDNPVVALILTAVVCGAFYLVGADFFTALFGHDVAGVLALLGSGSRFESITRGVLDLRDLYYYVSIVGIFLLLNLYGLERLRWVGQPAQAAQRRWAWAVGLGVANLVAAHFWLAPLSLARLDLTEGRQYSLSQATRTQLASLQEPLLIRGYFSSRTHPLLAPLVPQMKDVLQEYAVAAGSRARVEIIDPQQDRQAEEEAASRYGVRPVPFQMASRHQAAVVSSYFDVVVAYGDQHETLGYRDLIEVKARGEGQLDVVLRDPEYALTRAIRKVVQAYESGGNPAARLTQPVRLNAYVSPDERLPEPLRQLRGHLASIGETLRQRSQGKLELHFADPDAGGGALARELQQRYGFGPQVASLIDPKPFWFYMVLESEQGQAVQVPLPQPLEREALQRNIDAALQRMAPGYLRTVAVWRPQGYGATGFGRLTEMLGEGARVIDTDLSDGRLSAEADVLLVLSPENLDDRQRFSIDQFLMRGGSVVLATSPFQVEVGASLTARRQTSGLEDWLAHHGLRIDAQMVLDERNAALPVPVQRSVGGLTVREIRMLPYPHFPDLRDDGLDPHHPITAALRQLTLNWASPIEVDEARQAGRQVARLLHSSPASWVSDSLDVLPDYRRHPETGFAVQGERGPRLLAVALEGRFESFYRGKDAPRAKDQDGTPLSVIEHSPASARLVVVASNAFGSDAAIDLASQGLNTLYLQPVAFLQNVIDWALEDRALLSLRGRSQWARTLEPLPEGQAARWEAANYLLAALGLAAVLLWRHLVARADRRRHQRVLAEV